MPIQIEIEAKFTVPDDSTFEKLLRLDALGDYSLASPAEQSLIDRYLDTANRDLLRSGHAFRRRSSQAGGPELVTVKAIGAARGAVHERAEHEVEVPSDAPPERWPAGPARDLVLKLAHDQPLVELLTLRQHRTARDLIRQDQRVAVVSLDRIEFGDGTARELEIELTPAGSAADLHAVGKLLRTFGLSPQPLSKLERAIALLDAAAPPPARGGSARPASRRHAAARPASARPARRPARKAKKKMGVRAEDPMAEAGRKILRYHWEQGLAHEPGTIAGDDPEELHDMRVATRRQRAALRIVEPYCRKKALQPVRDGLKALGDCLGAVRDLDVLLAAAREHQAKLAGPEAGALQGLLDSWTKRREAARVRMVDYLGGQAHAGFKERYTVFLDTPGAGVRAEANDAVPRAMLVAQALPAELWTYYGALRAFEKVLPWASVETLHALRISGKRLRYLMEFFREVLDRCVEKPIAAIVALQDQLGALQDSVVTIALVGEFLSGPEAAAHPETVAAAGHYRDACKARIAELRRGIDRPWSGVTDSGFKSCLARAAARL